MGGCVAAIGFRVGGRGVGGSGDRAWCSRSRCRGSGGADSGWRDRVRHGRLIAGRGRALIEVLGNLPFSVTWIDSRDEIFPLHLPGNVACEYSDPVHAAVVELAPLTRVLIMSFSHAEDLDVVASCLQRQRESRDLPYIGLIGSKTKWATFRHRLQQRGFLPDELAWVTSPIGVHGVVGKEPEVIAVAVAAQLLQLKT